MSPAPIDQPTSITVGELTLTRVLYTDALVPAERTGLSPEQVTAVAWNGERWSGAEGQVRVGAATWVISTNDRHLAIDPFMAADDIFHDPDATAFHQQAITAMFEAAGLPLDRITDVAQSHIEGIGMVAVRDDSGDWRPFFPNARVHVSDESYALFRDEPGDDRTVAAWEALFAAGLVKTYADGSSLLPSIRAQHTGAHNPGHYVFNVGTEPAVTFVGHLAVSPLHLSTGLCPAQHPDPQLAQDVLESLAADGRILIGPLWPSPGAGRYIDGMFAPIA